VGVMHERATADGPGGVCREPETYSAGETLVDGENKWFFETLCRACDLSLVKAGRGFVAEPWRAGLLELTGRWRIRIDQGSDVGVPVLRFLRRVFRCSISDAHERRQRLLDEGFSGSRGETTWLASELSALGVATSVTQETAGTQTELPERRMPMPPARIGAEAGGPTAAIEDEVECSRIAGYLNAATCLVVGGRTIDPITRDPRDLIAEAVMTDGVYVWSLVWATLLRRHGLPLDEGFVAHVRGLGYQPPALSAAEIAAAQIATGLEPPEDTALAPPEGSALEPPEDSALAPPEES
jgi:hypothetical protein